jgi:hypothetical protein
MVVAIGELTGSGAGKNWSCAFGFVGVDWPRFFGRAVGASQRQLDGVHKPPPISATGCGIDLESIN